MIEEYNDGVIELRTSHPKEELEKWENEIRLKVIAEVEKIIKNIILNANEITEESYRKAYFYYKEELNQYLEELQKLKEKK